jgi:transmembrane sensor
MTDIDRARIEAAIDWLVRQRDSAFADWEVFGDWLAADPANAEAYRRAALDLEEVDAELAGASAPAPAVDPARPVQPWTSSPAARRARPGWRIGGGLAVAAVAVGAVALSLQTTAPSSDLYAVETRPGERRDVAIDASVRVALNGGTRLTLDRNDARYASLDRGQALFDVRHDPARPFRVDVAGARLVDIGTRFEVVRADDGFDLAVSEGEVRYERGQQRVSVTPGATLAERNGRTTVGRIAPASVGSWRDGRLVYDGVPVARVADDLSRSLGVPIRVSPATTGRRFRGVIILDGGAERVMPGLGALLGLTVRRAGSGWQITT